MGSSYHNQKHEVKEVNGEVPGQVQDQRQRRDAIQLKTFVSQKSPKIPYPVKKNSKIGNLDMF